MTEQNLAADPRRSAWVSANAGAGKTYTLANRVTRLLLDAAKPERILCLTYTKAAAAEMAGRLFEQLGKWAMADDADLSRLIADIGGGQRDAEGLREARRLFALALETPGGLKIQTIHSFCQYLLARFPLEAGVSPSFRILDDASARELVLDARTRVLHRAGSGDEKLAEAVDRLVTETSEASLNAVLAAAFGSDRRKFDRFLAQTPDEDLRTAIAAAHGAKPGETAEELARAFVSQMRQEENLLRDIASWLSGGSANDQRAANRILDSLADGAFDSFAGIFLNQDGRARRALVTNASAKSRPDLQAHLERMARLFTEIEERRRAAHAASLAEAAIVLIQAARQEYEKGKEARAALDYDDLIVATERLLGNREAAQWVLYKLDGGLDHVLIDEAQDTSPAQWSIVKRLTEEFFAGEGIDRGGGKPRTLFAVGDEKQSIFSFQGADPREFEVHRKSFAASIGSEGFADVRLEVSRRSVPEILRFVDEVFSPPGAREGVVSDDTPIAHCAHRKDEIGRVEVWPLVGPSGESEPDVWRPVNLPSIASPSSSLAAHLADQIVAWTDGTKCLPGKNRPVRPGDIMVLMPRREPFAGALIRALKQRHIPVAGADRIRIANQIAVMDLIALGRFCLLPEDDFNLAALLRSPLLDWSEDDLYRTSEGRSARLWQAIEIRRAEDGKCADAFDFLSRVLAGADFAPPYEFYAAVLSTPGVRRRMLTRLGTEAADAIDEFLSLTLSFEALNTPSLETFLHWVEHGDTEIKRDMERARDEVRVMTVHGAKGLEADIVILPDTAAAPGGTSNRSNILFPDNIPVFNVRTTIAPAALRRAADDARRKAREEHRRLLYVALTRARDRLYICGFHGPNGPDDDSWYRLAEGAAQKIATLERQGDKTVHVLGAGEFVEPPAGHAEEEPSFDMPAWITQPAAAERERRLIRPSEAAGADEPGAFSPAGVRQAARFRRGNIVHALLSRLPEIARSQRRAAAGKYLAAQRVSAEEAELTIAETLAVIDDPRFAPAFGPNARAEVAIVADLPEIGEGARVNGRIDRLAVTEDEILAVDFKTNRSPPVRTCDVPKLYIAQTALYRAALAKIFPGKEIVCALVWTDGPSLMRLDNAVLDAELARMAAQVGFLGGQL